MNDFLKGYSQGMTGSTNGLPSQSVLEAMGRDAARNQWNNTPAQRTQSTGPSGTAGPRDSIPVTTLLYEAGKKMRLRKLLRDAAISLGLMTVSIVLYKIFPRSLGWAAELPSIAGMLLMSWVFLRTPFYLIGRIGILLGDKNKPDAG